MQKRIVSDAQKYQFYGTKKIYDPICVDCGELLEREYVKINGRRCNLCKKIMMAYIYEQWKLKL